MNDPRSCGNSPVSSPSSSSSRSSSVSSFRAEKRSAQASAHPLSQAQGGLFCVLTVFDNLFVCD